MHVGDVSLERCKKPIKASLLYPGMHKTTKFMTDLPHYRTFLWRYELNGCMVLKPIVHNGLLDLIRTFQHR